MAPSVTAAALLLAQISAFVTIKMAYSCMEYNSASSQNCGNQPTVSDVSAILYWDRGVSNSTGAYLDIRRVDNAWNQKGCFSLGYSLLGSGHVPASSSYTIPSRYVDYDSLYVVRMRWNFQGSSYYGSDCYFTLQPTPSAPQNVAAVHTTSSSITWTWDPPANHGNKVTYYRMSNGATTSGTYYQMSRLSGYTQYRFRVRAVTGSGYSGNWSPWQYHRTLPATPSRPRVSIDGITARSVRLTLSGCRSARVGTFRYTVTYRSDSGNELTVETATSTSPPSLLTVRDLRPGKQYSFRVRCENSAGITGPSVSTTVTTSSEETLQPRISSVVVSNSLAFADISWDAPSAVDLVSGYDVQVVPHVGGTPQSPSVYLMASSSRYSRSYRVMQSLMPETLYTFQVRANTSVGTSQWSTPVVRSTLPAVPPAVSPLAAATGVLGAIVVIGIVAVSLLFAYTCFRWMRRKKEKHHAVPDDNTNCELQENLAYITAAHNKLWSEDSEMEEEEKEGEREEEGCEEGNTYVKDKAMDLEPASPELPCRQYLQEKEKGQTVFASIPVLDEIDFKRNSGWSTPTVADVIASKLGMDAAAFADLGSGVYFMCHKTKMQAKWVGLSPDLCRTLCGLVFQLYHKERSQLSPVEVELKFFSPLAADWDIQVWTAEPKELVLERAKKIVEFKTLKPLGLNNALTFTTTEMWEEFTGWFAAQRRKK